MGRIVPSFSDTKGPGSNCFSLLPVDDLEELRGLLSVIFDRRAEILLHGSRLYAQKLGHERCLSQAEFIAVFEPAIGHGKAALLEGTIERYASEIMRLGSALIERGVSAEEAVMSVYLLERSVRSLVPNVSFLSERGREIFERLNYARMFLLISAYFRSYAASYKEGLAALEREEAQLDPNRRIQFRGLIGASGAMRGLYRRIERESEGQANILIVGERGTGKELVARAIHGAGRHDDRPFIAVACASIPSDMIGSQLFGGKGSQVGVVHDAEYLGAFRAADYGTLFVDEITALSSELQNEFQQVIGQEARSRRGESQAKLRVIASTTWKPEVALAEGRLSPRLYEELRPSTIEVIPLRHRSEDIPQLVDHFIALFAGRTSRTVVGIEDCALQAMKQYTWPSNVRELSRTIEHAVVFGKGRVIGMDELPPIISASAPEGTEVQPLDGQDKERVSSYAEMERDLIRRTLKTTLGNKLRAAQQLQISRKKLYAKIKRFGL